MMAFSLMSSGSSLFEVGKLYRIHNGDYTSQQPLFYGNGLVKLKVANNAIQEEK